jgi:hypothetical protein
MKNTKVLLVGGHGLGDCLMSLQCAAVVYGNHIEPDVIISARDEVYKPLYNLFSGMFNMTQVDESYAAHNHVLRDESAWLSLTQGYDEAYYVIPDLLFHNEHAFDCAKYNTSPQMIRDVRLLQLERAVSNTVFVGLMTTTAGYMYDKPMELAIALAEASPAYKFYFPIVTKWAGKDISPIEVPSQLPSNLWVDVNPIFTDALNVLLRSCYFVGTDNGPSHLAYHAAIPRLLLDPQFGRLPWVVRWREDYLESIPITSPIGNIVNVVSTNLAIPQTLLAPRLACLSQKLTDWPELLWLKKK